MIANDVLNRILAKLPSDEALLLSAEIERPWEVARRRKAMRNEALLEAAALLPDCPLTVRAKTLAHRLVRYAYRYRDAVPVDDPLNGAMHLALRLDDGSPVGWRTIYNAMQNSEVEFATKTLDRRRMLIRRPASPPEPPPPPPEMPRSEAEVDAALLDLEKERVRIRAALAGVPAQESELLNQDADDAAFTKLDNDRKRNERALARLEIRESQLIGIAERYRSDAHQVAYTAIRERYIAASRALAAGAEDLAQRLAAVNVISDLATRSGFDIMRQPTLPPVGYSPTHSYTRFDAHLSVLHEQAAVAERTPRQVPRTTPQVVSHAIRFLQWCEVRLAPHMPACGYQRGQIASFSGSVCQTLVANGQAEWMRRGMQFDAWEAMWGAGPAPAQHEGTVTSMREE